MFRFLFMAFLLMLLPFESFSKVTGRAPAYSKLQGDSMRYRTDSIAKLDRPKMMFSIGGGPAVSTFYREKYLDHQVPFFRYGLGVNFIRSIGKRFAFGSSLLWEAKGSKSDYPPLKYSTDPLGDTRYVQGWRLNYLTLALTGQYFFDSKHRFYGGLGVSLGYLVKNEGFTYNYDTNGDFTYQLRSAGKDIRDFEAGLIATIGYNHRVGKKVFLCSQLIGNLGVTDLDYDLRWTNTYPKSNASAMLMIAVGLASN
jgi:hypothetical protein